MPAHTCGQRARRTWTQTRSPVAAHRAPGHGGRASREEPGDGAGPRRQRAAPAGGRAAGRPAGGRGGRGLPRMGRARAGAEETEGAGRPAGGRGRPLPAVRGSAPPSATATAAPRRPPGPGREFVPRGRARVPGPAPGGGAGQGTKAPRESARARPLARGLPGPPAGEASQPSVRRLPAASGPGRPGRRSPSTLRAQRVGSRDEHQGPRLEGLREHNPCSHCTDAAAEARGGPGPADRGRDLEGSAT